MYSFESSGEKTDRVSKACRQIQLTHHSKPAYLLNVSVAYDILCQNKGIRYDNDTEEGVVNYWIFVLPFAAGQEIGDVDFTHRPLCSLGIVEGIVTVVHVPSDLDL